MGEETTLATERQIKANRKNGPKGGVKTAEGKAVSRLNARKHGIMASALTEYDEEGVQSIHEELAAWIRPVGPIEQILVEKLAHTYLRLQRCARAEAEHHIVTWEPRTDSNFALRRWVEKKKLGMHASYYDPERFEWAVKLFARYDTALTNQFVKLLHEIERLQRMRLGDNVPPPVVADVTVHSEDAEED